MSCSSTIKSLKATEQNVHKMSNILGFSPPKKKTNSINNMKNISKSLEEIPMTIEELLASERKTSPSKSPSSVSPKRERAATDHMLKRAVVEEIKTLSNSVIRDGKITLILECNSSGFYE